MQVGRWNHQGDSGGAGSATRSRPSGSRSNYNRSGGSRSRSFSSGGFRSNEFARPAPQRGSFGARGRNFGARSGRSGGSGYGGRGKGGIGAFGKTEAEIAKFISSAVVAKEEPVFVPEHAFSDFAINDKLKENIAGKGYTLPSPIQDKAIPHVLAGEDVVGLAETGTGKTAAFLVPLIDKVMQHPEERVLVMAPTRELAVQIEKELADFARGAGFRGMVAVGGANIVPQIRALKYTPSFVIGTPGRLKDLEERGAIDFSTFGSVVLDEADRMLDMGFIDDMRTILGKMPKERHTLFFSATMTRDIERIIGDFMKNPTTISVKKNDTSKNVDQDVVRIKRGEDKFEALVKLLEDRNFTRVLVFGRTKYGVEKLAKALSRRHIHAESIHGDKSHNARLRALDAFKRGKVSVLTATDVAARGLDIPDVSHVINYDLPSTYEDYVHRIGRTGRGSNTGTALTFVEG